VEQPVLVGQVQAGGNLQADRRGRGRVQSPGPLHHCIQRLALNVRPHQVMQPAGGADVDERHHGRVRELAERPHLPRPGERSTCFAAAIPSRRTFLLSFLETALVNGPMLPWPTESVKTYGPGPGLGLSLHDAVGLKLRQDVLPHQVVHQDGWIGPRVSPQEIFDDLVQLAALDQLLRRSSKINCSHAPNSVVTMLSASFVKWSGAHPHRDRGAPRRTYTGTERRAGGSRPEGS